MNIYKTMKWFNFQTAFVRWVRNFLKINIVSQEELGDAKVNDEISNIQNDNPTSPYVLLEKVMNDKGISFETLKKRLTKEKLDGAETLKSVNDIPKVKIFELIERIKKA